MAMKKILTICIALLITLATLISTISASALINIDNDFDMITSLFNVSSLHYELLYRASRDGLEQEMFHNKSDDVSTK
jgi:hypothetical protein